MGYEVLARKWRPQIFADVVGQQHVTQTLHNAIRSDRLAHAYLFVGPRGTGKTTTARILAKALNCQNRQDCEPCNACDSCREIKEGNSLDVIEIDGASNRGIADVQELRDNVRYAPARGPFKIYIIDEVHMLTREAFNAILKTLEEPPPHVKFFFATTEPQKVLTTILSRCQRFDLRRISIADITAQLQKIAAAEGISIHNDALLAIARGAEGGLRDAESALDQLVSFRGTTIEESDVLSVFGLISREQLEGLANAILDGEIAAILMAVARIDHSGKDMQRIVLELLEHFRNLLIVMNAEKDLDCFELPSALVELLQKQAKKTSDGRLLRIIDLLIDVDGRMRYALSKRTLLEAALVRASRAATVATIDELMQQVAALKKSASNAAPEKKKPRDELEYFRSIWPQFIDHLAKKLPQSDRALRALSLGEIAKETVTFRVATDAPTVQKTLAQPPARTLLEKTTAHILKRTVGLQFIQSDRARPAPSAPTPQKRAAAPSASDSAHYLKHPAVQRVLEAFSGDIETVKKPGSGSGHPANSRP